jgi:hypothetical protein
MARGSLIHGLASSESKIHQIIIINGVLKGEKRILSRSKHRKLSKMTREFASEQINSPLHGVGISDATRSQAKRKWNHKANQKKRELPYAETSRAMLINRAQNCTHVIPNRIWLDFHII